jgi:alcohol dehydrogenase class IV
VVVAAGGGSALDFGKGVAVLAGNPGTAWQHTRRKDHTPLVPGPGTLPVVALPTTAGTGSEMTHYAVFSNPRLREKSTIVSERIIPRAALVDPELTFSCPPRLTALTGVDVLAHSIEAYINVSSSPFARLVSLEAIRLAGAWLAKAVADGSDPEARQQMAWASALGGVAIAHANPTLPHALGQAAGGFVHAPHGATVAACLAEVMRISHEAAPQMFADIASALDPAAAPLPLAERAARSASLMEGLLDRIGARVRFGELGLRAEDIERVTRIALTAYATGISLHPKQVDEREIQSIYRSCL